MVYLWPGLPRLWRRGEWSGLIAAVVFAALLNIALLSGVVWSEVELFVPAGRTIIWFMVFSVWAGSAAVSFGADRRRQDEPKPLATENSENAYAEALEHYLQRNWCEAERLLERLLRHDIRDVEARLMLVSVLRRERRFDEAVGQLDRLSRQEDSCKWEREIQRERNLLAEALAETNEEAAPREYANNERKQAA